MTQHSRRLALLPWIALVVILVSFVGGLVFYVRHSNSKQLGDSRTIKIVAGENFWGNIASQIGGTHVQVTSIITNPNADPHQYESDAHDSAAVAGADIVVQNGLGYDDFLTKLMSASPNANRQVLMASTIMGYSGSDANPHLWYDVPRVHLVAIAIESSLANKDPVDRAVFEQNLKSFETSLQSLINTMNQIKVKYPGATVAYTERVPGYMLEDAGLSVKTPVGFASAIEDGNDPSPSDTQTMESLISGREVKVLLYNAQATSSVTQHIKDLATQAGIPVIGVTETMPPSEHDYQTWQQDQINQLLNALGS
jgi:zinc/manganese transport system substrate-binding protein